MKKISIIVSTLLLSSSILSADITIRTGWQLLGATQDMNTTMFNDTCVDYIWKYDTSTVTPQWQIHVANGVNYAHSMTTISSFKKGDGYWVKGNADCTISLAETTIPSPVTTVTHKGVTYGTLISAETGRIWLDRNLGATQACTALDDPACYGDYYQWGREADGHEKSDSATTTTLSSTITAIDDSFIASSSAPKDWTSADLNGVERTSAWSKTDGTSICPVGYRVPTKAEFDLELANNAITNQVDAYNKLKLPSSATRGGTDGGIYNKNSDFGDFWLSSADNNHSYAFGSNSSNAYLYTAYRAYGLAVRCLKD